MQQEQRFLQIVDVDGLPAGRTVHPIINVLPAVEQHGGHVPAHKAGPSRRLHQERFRLLGDLSRVLAERRQLTVPNGQHRLVVVTHPQGLHAHLVDVGRDAPGHAAQELFGLGHDILLPLPLFHQGLDNGPLFLRTQVDHRAAGAVLHAANFHKPGVGGMVAVEGFGDGGGDEEHPVQVVPALTQGLAGDEALGDGLAVLVPLEVHVQVHALAAAVVRGAEKVGVFRDLPAVLPLAVHEKVLVREVPLALQPVFQLLEYLLS